MIRATHIEEINQAAESEQDIIELDFDLRHRRRMSMTSFSGKQFLLDLHKATVLKDGDLLALDDGSYITVRAKAERVAEITALNTQHLVQIAWHLGNRHLPTQILEHSLRILDDHVIVELAQGLGAQVEIIDAPFQPEGGAYESTQPHNHGHGHV
ncbi:MAG: urease accessory protein UreE [Pseudomonadales bacterium]|nr:urease accessory protein UreE [Pseudomonadales bacterium]